MRWSILIYISCCVNLLWSATGRAVSEVVPAHPHNFHEAIDPRPDVSGSPIVGFRLGEARGSVDVDDIYIVIPSIPPPICIEATTQDGRFSAENLYLDDDPSEKYGTFAKVKPFAQAKRTKNAVEEYPLAQLAIRAYQNKEGSCVAKDAVFLPQCLKPSSTAKSLFVQVNAGSSSTSAVLEYVDYRKKRVTGVGKCHPAAGNAHLTFNTICRFEPLRLDKPTKITVMIMLDDGFDEETFSTEVLIPEGKLKQ